MPQYPHIRRPAAWVAVEHVCASVFVWCRYGNSNPFSVKSVVARVFGLPSFLCALTWYVTCIISRMQNGAAWLFNKWNEMYVCAHVVYIMCVVREVFACKLCNGWIGRSGACAHCAWLTVTVERKWQMVVTCGEVQVDVCVWSIWTVCVVFIQNYLEMM